MNSPLLSPFSILFVDDEEKTRKMFARLISPYFKVLLAEDVPSAITVLDTHADSIGVLLTDQRMPGQLGVDLLRHVRKEQPSIIRLLTTAYSDLDDAIEAVNTGEIFRYINKPWNIDELLIDLRLAMSFFQLQQDRQHLISEKLSIGNKQSKIALIKALLYSASSQTAHPNAAQAVTLVLQQIGLAQDYIADSTASNAAYWENEVKQTQCIMSLNKQLSSQLNAYSLPEESQAFTLSVDDLSLPEMSIDGAFAPFKSAIEAEQLSFLLRSCAGLFGLAETSAHLKLTPETGLTQLRLTNPEPNSALSASFAVALADESQLNEKAVANLIASSILLHTLGGKLDLNFVEANLESVVVSLPESKTASLAISDDANDLEDLFVLFS